MLLIIKRKNNDSFIHLYNNIYFIARNGGRYNSLQDLIYNNHVRKSDITNSIN